MSQITVIAEDTPCLQCGYNLRTLVPEAACPECGLGVRASLEQRAFNVADRRRVAAVMRGAMGLMVSVAMTGGSMLLYTALWMEVDVEPTKTLTAAFFAWVMIEHVLWVVGSFGVTRGPTAARSRHAAGVLSWATCIATSVNLACMSAVAVFMGALAFDISESEFMMLLAVIAAPATFVARLVAVLLLGAWLSRLAEQAGLALPSREMRVLAVFAGIGLGLLCLSVLALFGGGAGHGVEDLWKGLTIVFAGLSFWAALWLLRFIAAIRRRQRACDDQAG